MKILAALLCFAAYTAVVWTDGWVQRGKEKQTPVVVVKESGHAEWQCRAR